MYLTTLVEVLRQAQANGPFNPQMALLLRPAVLIVEAIGYLPLSDDGGRLCFQRVNARHEPGPMILTTNNGFEARGSVVGDEVMAAATRDRLLHWCHVANIQGAKYSTRDYKAAHGRTEQSLGTAQDVVDYRGIN